jgi:hypothetical protein
MIRERVTVKDYLTIVQKHKIFVWHFLQKDQCKRGCLSFFSYFDEPEDKKKSHQIREILNLVEIPYFESLTEESIDFLVGNGISTKNIWKNGNFSPLILGFKDGVVKNHTGLRCYCQDVFLEMIAELDPKLLLNI